MKNLLLLIAFTLLAFGCAPATTVTRTAADEVTDISGKWNETDARLVAEEMMEDMVNRPWLGRFQGANNNAVPTLIVGGVRNETMEHIDTEVFTKELEREMINSGMIQFVASAEERAQIREERIDQQSNATLASMKELARELGADYMLIGNISSIVDRSQNGREASVYYTTNLELIDIESNVKVWIGNKKIKKLISRSGSRF